MLEIWLIRHGMTEGNKFSRYIGVTDDPLCREGKELLKKFSYPCPQAIYVSPMTRCRETAEILFPGKSVHIMDELSECNFGDFENKNYKDLEGDPAYQRWVDSGGLLPFPNGESREEFQRRSIKGFRKVVAGCLRSGITSAAVVAHGGTIMSVMDEYACEHREFYEWHVKNGEGYHVELDPLLWKKDCCRLRVCESLRAVSMFSEKTWHTET